MFLNDELKRYYGNRMNMQLIFDSNSADKQIADTTTIALEPLGIYGPFRGISSTVRKGGIGTGDTWTITWEWRGPVSGSLTLMSRVLTDVSPAFGECTLISPWNVDSQLAIPAPTHLAVTRTVDGGDPAFLKCLIFLTTAV